MNEDPSRRPPAVGETQATGASDHLSPQQPDDIAVMTSFRTADTGSGEAGAPDAGADPDISALPTGERTISNRQRGRVLGSIRELVETIVLALIFFFALRAVVQNFRVEGSSMFPSFTDGQYVLVNKAVYVHFKPGEQPGWLPLIGAKTGAVRYLFQPPERGDVIVFHPPPPNDQRRDFIKRVIGLPGDTVDIRQGHVYVNGAELTEPFIRQPTLPINVLFAHTVLGPGEYYVMGDNRGNSSDSRAWGGVKADAIVGRTWLIYWPFDSIRLAPNHLEAAPTPAPTAP